MLHFGSIASICTSCNVFAGCWVLHGLTVVIREQCFADCSIPLYGYLASYPGLPRTRENKRGRPGYEANGYCSMERDHVAGRRSKIMTCDYLIARPTTFWE